MTLGRDPMSMVVVILLAFCCFGCFAGDVFVPYADKPTDNPLKERLGKPLATGGFERKGYHLWDPSIIRVGDKYHMFTSCWPAKDFNDWKKSYIVRATSDNLLGPYTFAEEVFRPRKGKYFDSQGCHNPKITCYKGKYYLYYLGIPTWQSGVAVADSVEGPWKRTDKACIPANNPAIWIHKDGSVYGLGKRKDKYAANDPSKSEQHPLRRNLEVLQAKDLFGPYISLTQRGTSALPKNYEHEDPCVWFDDKTYHVIVIDWRGFATGHNKGFTYYTSSDGLKYELVSKDPLFSTRNPIQFSDGSQTKFRRIERPNIVLDQAGHVAAILAACLPADEKLGSRILIFPVREPGSPKIGSRHQK